MATMVLEMASKYYNHIFYDLCDQRIVNLPMMTSPIPIVIMLACYVTFVKVLGPAIMKNRPPYNIDRIIQVYNAVQIAISLWLVERGLTLGWGGTFNWNCQPIDYSNSPRALETVWVCYCYFLVKVLDLLDTVFFILRKKNNQVTFLHLYHHVAMALGMWGGIKYLPGGHGTFMGFINAIVHAVMYSYYLLTSLYPEYKKNIWWKKHLTQMQMVQFFVITIHTLQLLVQPNCNYPKVVIFLLVPQNAFMFVMFYDFYKKAYYPKNTGKIIEKNGNHNLQNTMQHRQDSEKKIS